VVLHTMEGLKHVETPFYNKILMHQVGTSYSIT
jgi:hypothetical protein